jgi:peptidoglycan glycosyltransferase
VNPTIRRVGIGMLVLFLGLVAQATYLQIVRADDLKNDPRNVRVFLRDYSRPRGEIRTVDRTVLARSVPTDDELEQIRVYPPETASLFAHVVGYQAVNLGNTGVEAEYNDYLVGRDFDIAIDDISDFFSGEDPVGNVVLSMSLEGQQLAANALGDQRGSVVVLDVETGAIVAAYSNPTFDPNPLASHDTRAAQAFFDALNADPNKPALARAWREIFPPGSTFKVVTTGIGLQSELVPHDPSPPGPPYRLTLDNPVYPELEELDLPQSTSTLSNFGGSECGGTLAQSFRVSCNTTFAQIGLDLGDTFATGIERFGVSAPAADTDLRPGLVRSIGPEQGTFQQNQAGFAQAAIGQGGGPTTVAVTPMAMAMVAQSVANEGVMMVPHVLDHVENNDGELIRGTRYEPREYARAMEASTAATVRDLMVDVVNNGTGTRARIPGIQVAGKTGTAQVEGQLAHAWFIAFAPAEAPRYAIAVLVENGGQLSSGDNGTGGRVAAPIAAQVLGGLLTP